MAKAAASYAMLYDDLEWLCGDHPSGGSRIDRLARGIHFLDIPTEAPHLVQGHGCGYGFTDMEPKSGHVLFTSLLVLEGAALLGAAIQRGVSQGVPGCAGKSEEPLRDLLELAALVNDSIASGYMDDSRFGSNLLLATDVHGNNAQPDVWGSGLAVAIGAGTEAQRARISAALAANASNIFRWGQARHLPWPMCWEHGKTMPGYMNPAQCTETGKGALESSWCRCAPPTARGRFGVRTLRFCDEVLG